MVFIVSRRMCIPFNQRGHDVELIAALCQGGNRAESAPATFAARLRIRATSLKSGSSAMGEDRDCICGG